MAGWIETADASLANGSKVITLKGAVDASFVASSTAVVIETAAGTDRILEAVAGTSPDGSGTSTITLRHTYNGTSIVSKPLKAFNTIEGLRDAIQGARTLMATMEAKITEMNQAIAGIPKKSTDLSDMPQSLTGQGGKTLKVKTDGSGYELVT